MPHREEHAVKEYDARDDDGEEYVIIEYQEVMERRTVGNPNVEWVKTGPSTFRLDDRTPVNRIDADTFKIATNDTVLKLLG